MNPSSQQIIDVALENIQFALTNVLVHCDGAAPGTLPIHHASRSAQRFVGHAEATAALLEDLAAIDARTTLAAFGLVDVAPCIVCGDECYHEDVADPEDGDDSGWAHYTAADHEASIGGSYCTGFGPDANRVRFLRATTPGR